jgi:hypothetical protein
MTVTFTPGVSHGHRPSGRWSEVQRNPNSSFFGLNRLCAVMRPRALVNAAANLMLNNKPIAADHLRWYLAGSGVDYDENANLALLLRTDAGVQALIARHMRRSRTGRFHLEIQQSDYAVEDLQFAFGAIDRLDVEVNTRAGTLHAWFLDRYEWHPYYPLIYTDVLPGDSILRPSNCVHAACVELKDARENGGRAAADFWMRGEATVPLSVIRRHP